MQTDRSVQGFVAALKARHAEYRQQHVREYCSNCAVIEVELLGGLCQACEHQIVDMLAEEYAEQVLVDKALY